MVPPLELAVGGAVLAHILLLAAVGYYDAVAATGFYRRFGASPASVVAAGTVGSAFAVALAVAGRLPPWLDLGARSVVLTLGLLAAPLVVGAVGVAVAAGNARTLRRLDRPGVVPTGGDAVLVSGTARPVGDAARSPLFGRPALCWTWRLDARNWGGSDGGWFERLRAGDGDFHRVRGDGGGVPFVLVHEAGRLRVDPADAAFELRDERVEETPPETFPDGADPTAVDHDWSLPGDRWRHRERVLEPGATATVLGEATDGPEGPTVAGGDPFVVAAGGPERFRRRCRTRLRVGALVALAGLFGGTWLLVATFAVPLPV
jgi:hypothetical protein